MYPDVEGKSMGSSGRTYSKEDDLVGQGGVGLCERGRRIVNVVKDCLVKYIKTSER